MNALRSVKRVGGSPIAIGKVPERLRCTATPQSRRDIMETRSTARLAAAALIAGGAIACNRSESGHGTNPESTSSTSRRGERIRRALERERLCERQRLRRAGSNRAGVTTGHWSALTGSLARGARANSAANVGTGRKWPALDDCTRQITSDWRKELNAFECPGGILEGARRVPGGRFATRLREPARHNATHRRQQNERYLSRNHVLNSRPRPSATLRPPSRGTRFA
jgi:hypothetical protein